MTFRKRIPARLFAAALITTAICAPVHSQEKSYPDHPVKVVVSYTVGSNPDLATRIVMDKLQEKLGQPIYIVNRPGAVGNIGLAAAAQAAPDGYTLAVGHISTLTVNPVIYSNMPFDPNKAFVPIAQIYQSPVVAVVGVNSPYHTLDDLIADAKARPGKLSYGTAGSGTGGHLVMEYIRDASKISVVHVPYGSMQNAFIGVANNELNLALGSLSAAAPLIKGGKLRALAVTSDTAIAELPDTKPVADTFKGFVYNDWSGILAPAGTSPAIVKKLQQEISQTLQDPKVRKLLDGMYLHPVKDSPQQFQAFIHSEQGKWGGLARKINLKVD